MIFSQIFIDYSLVISYNTVMKTSCAGAIRGLWDELNQGLFPWIDDDIGELDARHRLFMAVCEAVIRPREFDYAKWKGNGRPPASRLKIFKAFLLKAVLNVKDTKEFVRMLRAEPIRAACAELGTVAVIDANPRRSAEAHAMGELEREVYRDRSAAERFFSHLLESHGGRTVRVRAPAKVALHLLLGTIVVAVEQMLRMVC